MAKKEVEKEEAKTLTKKEIKEQKKQEKLKQKEKQAKKDKKEKKPGLFRKLKEAWGELKKVTWPKFATVVKQTGVVILVVLIFTVVLFGIDYLLGLLYNLFMS
ncbi:MAG: preprotein translocase subunit SecE [Clostridia bacterium]|nr:preprotein translocase subunit SecE [Clostridia bacterium]